MSGRKLSPTANLLRTSRLFTLPPPLPKPVSAFTATSHYESDTATNPYPINAAIETSDSSLGRGDWGLKRALPLKSTTKSSSPTIRIGHIDSIDHITDFSSAADHTRTLRKWQEMDLSVSVSGRNPTDSLKSVFDSSHDNTQIKIGDSGKGQDRWKYKGPWLAGQTHGEYSDYVAKTMKKRRLDFKRFLSERLANTKNLLRRRDIIESGGSIEDIEPAAVTPEELDHYMRRLRKSYSEDPNSKSELDKLVEEFLDVPVDTRIQRASQVHQSINRKGPPSTHPSAGLSYLRTHSHSFNHPMYGPQEEKPPVEARVLAPQVIEGKRQLRAILGIGGIVFGDDKATFERQGEKADVAEFEPDIRGGGKLWIQAKHASIDPRGRIEFGNKRADKNAVNVLRGESEYETVLPAAALTAAKDRNVPDLSPRLTGQKSSQGYGIEEQSVSKSGRAQPFTGRDSINSLIGAFMEGKDA